MYYCAPCTRSAAPCAISGTPITAPTPVAHNAPPTYSSTPPATACKVPNVPLTILELFFTIPCPTWVMPFLTVVTALETKVHLL